ncbi:MAG TPA: GNAT family N-acetyltransferase [Rhodanobacteraceae bacterium]|jgi:GNAT superfamily N-acetyltransferase
MIRPIRKEDATLERMFIKRLSPESRRLRFLGQMNEASDELVKSLTDIDYERDVAFIALVHRDGEKREIGVARYGTNGDGTACECAVTVADEWRKRGLGVALMRHLIGVARSRGVRSMFSIDEADNAGMRDLAKFLGFRRTRDPDDATQVIHTLTLQ